MRSILLTLLLCLTASAQAPVAEYYASAEVKLVLSNVDGLQTVGTYTIVNVGSKPTTEPMGIIRVVVPEGGATSITASDVNRKSVGLEYLEDNQTWLLRNQAGKVWIDAVSTWLEWPEGPVDPAKPPVPKVKQQVKQFILELVPPGPGPGPGPAPGPTPTPTPTPEPIPVPPTPAPPMPGEGLKVLIIYEQDETTASQGNVLFSKSLKVWLMNNCAGSRILDQHSTGEASVWIEALKRPRAALPWIIISNKTTGYEGPLPATEAEVIALIGKYK